jgi:hypothetical protein
MNVFFSFRCLPAIPPVFCRAVHVSVLSIACCHRLVLLLLVLSFVFVVGVLCVALRLCCQACFLSWICLIDLLICLRPYSLILLAFLLITFSDVAHSAMRFFSPCFGGWDGVMVGGRGEN